MISNHLPDLPGLFWFQTLSLSCRRMT